MNGCCSWCGRTKDVVVIVDTDFMLCIDCIHRVVQQLSIWKDLELQGELDLMIRKIDTSEE